MFAIISLKVLGMNSKSTLYLGDCIEKMKLIEDNCVNLVLTDPPYGTTNAKWDSVIPFIPMWFQINRVVTNYAAIVLFGTQPFTSKLICSNISSFKYCWAWVKERPVGHLVAKYRPMQQTEDIVVFGNGKISYYPQMIKRDKPIIGKEGKRSELIGGEAQENATTRKIYTHKFPITLIKCKSVPHIPGSHPTQKPIALMEYFIKTYTKEGDTVLDFTMGMGSTGIACMNLDRNFIGIERNPEYFETSERRINTI